MAYSAWFQCVRGCEGHWSLYEVIYRCPICGDLLEVQHDLEALAERSADAWKDLLVARSAAGAWPLGSGVWSQRELVGRYYDLREGPDQPLLAWQMNWKGENYYTGNRVYAFQALDNKAIRAWMDTHRGETAFVVLEHTRLNSFRTLVGARRLEVLTDERFNNKFVLVRVSL